MCIYLFCVNQKNFSGFWPKIVFFSTNFWLFSKIVATGFHFCSDFRYESNGIFVLGVGFFSFFN